MISVNSARIYLKVDESPVLPTDIRDESKPMSYSKSKEIKEI